MLLTEYSGRMVKPTKGLVIEVDGVYHYPRNSMEPLGKNTIKFKVLKALGYHKNSFAVPYYDWAILEDR